MSRIPALLLCVIAVMCGGHVLAQNHTLPDTYLDLKQAHHPDGIDRNMGYNVIQGKPSSARIAPDASTSTVLQPLRHIKVDPNVGGYNATGSGDCGARCLGNQKRAYGASETGDSSYGFAVAPLVTKPKGVMVKK